MGACILSNDANCKQHSVLKQREIKLLKLMYQDLATRARQNALTQENFSVFFHLSGLWSDCVFKRFDTEGRGILTFEDFRRGIEKLSKGSFDSQVEVLFRFYACEDSTITFKQLLKMLYSYPKQDLKDMLNDDSFLTGMDVKERRYYFGNNAKLDDSRIVVEEGQDQYENPSGKNLPLQQIDTNRITTVNDFANIKSKKVPQTKEPRRFSESFNHLPFLNSKNRVKLTCNISVVVKKFAAYLFKEFGLDKDKGRLQYEQFRTLIKNHTKIFTQYFEGFHLYIWQCDQQGKPNFKNSTSWYESPAQEINIKEGDSYKRYINYMKNTLLIFKNKEDVMPVEIKNLQGLQVEAYSSEEGKSGIVVKHRDGIYPEKAYLFESVVIRDEWLRHLKQFCGNGNIHDLYRLEQKIGAGNYSVVYKALDKKTQNYVAIKVIEKFKLSVAEKEVLKNECSILQLCHHPRIANFIKKIETKTNLYIITELMKEGDLSDYIKKKGFLEEYQASWIIRQIIQAMLYLKSLGIIHRDLKPQNVMIKLKKDKQSVQSIKIIDFGFAIFKDNLANLKGKQKFVGTPNYVAPQILLQSAYDERVDNFSIGVILFFMLDGKLPFDSIFSEEIYEATIECRYETDNLHWMNISKGAKDLVARLLTTQDKRFSLAEALKHPWVSQGEDMKACAGKNRKQRYI